MGTIDLTTNFPFNPSVWIGIGKEFSDSLPQEVHDAKQKTLEIPKDFLDHLPRSTIGVHDFICWNPPFQSGSPSLHVTTEWFSNDNPRTDPNILITRSIPSTKVLEDLDIAVGQVWLDGGHSIVDPRFNDGTERFPFWALSLWKEVEKLIEYRGKWEKSVHWLDSVTHPVEMIAQTKDIIGRISWNEPLCSRGATSIDLTGFLGVSWLSDTQIDMMIDTLQERMKAEEHTEGSIVETVAFSHEMVLVAGGMKEPTSKYLSRVTDHIRRTHAKILWFPIYVNDSHWITGRVDFQRRAFAFGELRSWPVMQLKTYLQQVTRGSCKRMYLPHNKC